MRSAARERHLDLQHNAYLPMEGIAYDDTPTPRRADVYYAFNYDKLIVVAARSSRTRSSTSIRRTLPP
jgi:hypothetical protein